MFLGVRTVAHSTGKRLNTRMTPLVNFETAGAPEGLLTLRTRVGFLSAV